MVIPPMERFMRKVQVVGECWLWTGVTAGSKGRYGYFREGTKTSDPKVPAHRWIYEQRVGPIPDGHEVDHVRKRGCTSRLCVNPAHLEPVTHEENSLRARLDVCRAGKHDLTNPANMKFDGKGRRRGCYACVREREALGRPTKKARA